MTVEFPEPKTEDEAQRLKRFLEGGGQVAITVVQAFDADGAARATIGQSATLKFPATAESVLKVLAGGGERRVTITLDLSEVKASDQFIAAVFINRPDASVRTSLDEPGFAGTVGFFVHSQDHVGPSDKGDAEALRYELDVTTVLKRLQRPADNLTATVVLFPHEKVSSASVGLAVRRISLKVLESTVKRSS
jgi:hypothetical protein